MARPPSLPLPLPTALAPTPTVAVAVAAAACSAGPASSEASVSSPSMVSVCRKGAITGAALSVAAGMAATANGAIGAARELWEKYQAT